MESRGIISNLTELFYLHTLSITRSSFHPTFFRSIHRSVFRLRFTKNGFTGPKSLRGFRETCPWPGTLCCVLKQGTLHSQCLSPPRSKNRYWWIVRETKKNCGGVTCDGLASRPGEVEILLAASCYRNRDKAPAATNPSDSKASLLFKPNNVNDVDAHFEVYSKFIALKSNQGFSVR